MNTAVLLTSFLSVLFFNTFKGLSPKIWLLKMKRYQHEDFNSHLEEFDILI